ncbi:VanZ family protein [Clostridium sp. CCUG 7971]|uniref:VanZ family protein n=1 Tax=Clostridium sp. CCUG 7971 TaxID=2811414 RepID=UPI001ABA6F95|nr:VanZ family protein [Clostridium sp. CCUG 7971]MBO3444280.1 VanZ family protein [Clostridium sp. CCUG 7971]
MDRIIGYFIIAIIGFLGVCILYSPVYFILRKKKIPFIKQFSCLLLGFSIFIILVMTIFLGGIDFNPSNRFINFVPFKFLIETYDMGYKAMMSQVVANIIMFIPIGLLLPIVLKKCREFKYTCLYALLFTFLIEFVQYFIGRSCDIDDIIMNFIGSVLGYGIYKLFDKIIKNN